LVYNILYKKSVGRDLKSIPKAEAKRIVDQIEEALTKHPDSYPVLKGEFAGLRRMRIGDYRVIFSIMDGDVLVLRIGHRKDVYRGK
jgi:mRNA interferase RelE/StbE